MYSREEILEKLKVKIEKEYDIPRKWLGPLFKDDFMLKSNKKWAAKEFLDYLTYNGPFLYY